MPSIKSVGFCLKGFVNKELCPSLVVPANGSVHVGGCVSKGLWLLPMMYSVREWGVLPMFCLWGVFLWGVLSIMDITCGGVITESFCLWGILYIWQRHRL